MTAVPFNPFVTYTYVDGTPLSGGKIFTYIAGTSTPKDSYTNALGTVPATNPIVLDSAGRSPYGALWLSGDYKLTFADPAGAPIQTDDSISAAYGGGDMTKAVYDPANLSGQVVVINAVQTITQKTFDTTNTFGLNVPSSKINTAAFSVTSSIVPADITGVTWALPVGTYRVDFSVAITCASAGGFRFGGAFTGTATGKLFMAHSIDVTAVTNWPVSTTPFTAYSTTGVTTPQIIGTMVFVVTVSGTFTLQLGQSTSNATPTAIADGQLKATIQKI